MGIIDTLQSTAIEIFWWTAAMAAIFAGSAVAGAWIDRKLDEQNQRAWHAGNMSEYRR